MDTRSKLLELKKKKGALILAHYYQNEDVQKIADYVGDSYYLSRISKESKNEIVVFCGVKFMAESSKVLSPEKRVFLSKRGATCPMAEMINVEEVLKLKKKYSDVAIVTYINSSLELKAISDVIVTSSNAEKIIKKIKEKNIIFLPDKNLGSYLSEKIKDKNFIFVDGYCPIHQNISLDDVKSLKEKFMNVEITCHPECAKEIRSLSDFIGSTTEIIDFVNQGENREILVLTENGVNCSFSNKNIFHSLKNDIVCEDMKKTTLNDVYDTLLNEENEILIESKLIENASRALKKMHDLAQD